MGPIFFSRGSSLQATFSTENSSKALWLRYPCSKGVGGPTLTRQCVCVVGFSGFGGGGGV